MTSIQDRATITEAARTTSIRFHGDVVVCGAGPAGCAAAINAARMGAKVALVENGFCAGGIWTSGALAWLVDHENKGSLMDEILGALEQIGGRGCDAAYDIESMKVVLEQLLLQAGVTLQYASRVVDVISEKQEAGSRPRIAGVITESPSGREAWLAKVTIDCTGNGDVGALAGCGWDYGDPDGRAQPMSMMALVAGPQLSDIAELVCNAPGDRPHEAAKASLLTQCRACGLQPSYQAPTLWHIADQVYALMAHHAYEVCGFDAGDLTKASIDGRRELYDMVNILRQSGGALRHLRLVATAAQIGIREGRRLHGRSSISREDVIQGRRVPDSVCRVQNWVDIHTTKAEDDIPYHDDGVAGPGFDIPAEALIAADVDDLLFAGRCISGDFWAHAAYRVTGPAVAMGQAAGTMAVQRTFSH